MFSQKCTNCGQLITLKNEDIQTAIQEAENANRPTYQMSCPKCRRPVKIPVKTLKLKLPRPVTDSKSQDGSA